MNFLRWVLFTVWFAAPLAARAHGDVHDQIALVTQQIREEPRNATLYLKRGELNRFHHDWDAAQADYDRVTQLMPDFAAIDFFRGRMLLEAGRPRPARGCLDGFLKKHPDHAEALIARARVLVKLDENEAAARDFTQAIARLPRPKPDFYLERAEALRSAGDAGEALRGLDEGMDRLGPLVPLALRAIDLELARKNFDGALLRLDKALEQSPRRETWLARKGEVLLQAGRASEAREAMDRALKAIESLPPNSRKTRAMLALESRVRSALGTLQTSRKNSRVDLNKSNL